MERLKLEFYYGQEAEQFTFYRLPKALITDNRFKDISNNSKLLYGLMLDRMSLSVRSGWFDDQNRVYIKYSIKSIMEDLNCSKMTAVGLLKELQAIGLVDIEQRNGLANIIYVKNFVSGREEESLDRSENCTGKKNEPVEEHQSKNSTGTDIRPVNMEDQSDVNTGTCQDSIPGVVQKSDPNNNDFNNNEFSDTDHIIQSGERMDTPIRVTRMDQMDETTAYMELIRENIDYDIMMSNKKWSDREMYDELYQLICDVVCVPRKTIRIAGEDYPYNLVKSKFLKLNSTHLEYVIGCMKNNTTKVSNIKAYLTTALYNAPNTINVADVRDALSAFSRLINTSHKKVFDGVFDTLQTGLSKLGDSSNSQTKAISDLLHLIKDIPMDGKQDYDVLGFIYEYLISNFAANAGKKAGEFYTPHEVSLLMSEIVADHLKDRTEIKIYDPTSGSGSLLINIGKAVGKHMGDSDRIKYYAQELKENTYNLTRMNLVMRGILPDNIVTRNGDTLEEDWPYFDESDPVAKP